MWKAFNSLSETDRLNSVSPYEYHWPKHRQIGSIDRKAAITFANTAWRRHARPDIRTVCALRVTAFVSLSLSLTPVSIQMREQVARADAAQRVREKKAGPR